jgi:hypothetical protein
MGFGRVLAAPLVLGVCVCGWSPLVGFGLRGSPRQIGRAGLAFLLHQTPRTSAGSPVCTMSSGSLPRFSLVSLSRSLSLSSLTIVSLSDLL